MFKAFLLSNYKALEPSSLISARLGLAYITVLDLCRPTYGVIPDVVGSSSKFYLSMNICGEAMSSLLSRTGLIFS